MDEKEYEQKITEAVAETCHFKRINNFYVCQLCGKRYLIHFFGQPLNERMLNHFDQEKIAYNNRITS